MAGGVQAIRAGDQYRTELYVDFPRLRTSFREQLNAQLAENAATEMKDNPFGGLAAMLGSALVDRTVDAFVTPAGLARLMNRGESEADRARTRVHNSM